MRSIDLLLSYLSFTFEEAVCYMTTDLRAERVGVDRPLLTRCQHAHGDGRPETCHYLHMLERIREWTQRAEQAYLDGDGQRSQIGELWVLSAELAYAHDNCPNGAQLCEAILPRGTRHLREVFSMPMAQQ